VSRELPVRQVVQALHTDYLRRHGGAQGLRDQNTLGSAFYRAEHRAAYGKWDVFELVAAFAFGLARNRAFLDGNKRTAIVTTMLFLALNGHRMTKTARSISSPSRWPLARATRPALPRSSRTTPYRLPATSQTESHYSPDGARHSPFPRCDSGQDRQVYNEWCCIDVGLIGPASSSREGGAATMFEKEVLSVIRVQQDASAKGDACATVNAMHADALVFDLPPPLAY
jgi:death-on-curing protein